MFHPNFIADASTQRSHAPRALLGTAPRTGFTNPAADEARGGATVFEKAVGALRNPLGRDSIEPSSFEKVTLLICAFLMGAVLAI